MTNGLYLLHLRHGWSVQASSRVFSCTPADLTLGMALEEITEIVKSVVSSLHRSVAVMMNGYETAQVEEMFVVDVCALLFCCLLVLAQQCLSQKAVGRPKELFAHRSLLRPFDI